MTDQMAVSTALSGNKGKTRYDIDNIRHPTASRPGDVWKRERTPAPSTPKQKTKRRQENVAGKKQILRDQLSAAMRKHAKEADKKRGRVGRKMKEIP